MFNFGKKSPESAPNPNSSAWDMSNVPFAGNQKEAMNVSPERESPAEKLHRQQNKLIAILATADISIIGKKQIPEVPGQTRQMILQNIENGRIDKRYESAVLSHIQSPIKNFGPDQMYGQVVQNRHFARFLTFATGGNADTFEGLSPDSMKRFMEKFPTPVEFESTRDQYMAAMNASKNTPQKKAEYARDIDAFEKLIFGKQSEYHDAMKSLRAEAHAIYGQNNRGDTLSIDDTVRPAYAERQNDRVETRGERLFNSCGSFALTRAQSADRRQIRYGERIDASESQDTPLIDPSENLFGVFDGVGGVQNGRAASRSAAERVNQRVVGEAPRSGRDLANILLESNRDVIASGAAKGGYTTAILGRINRDNAGQRYLSWALIGDSRLYIVHGNGEAIQVGHDEGYDNKIQNAIGTAACYCNQFGDYYLKPGDRLVFCSDGVTGDHEPDLLRNSDIAKGIRGYGDQDAAFNLAVNCAKKRDDTTAIVVTP